MVKPKKGRRPERQRSNRRDGHYELENDEDIALMSKPFEASIKGVIDLMKAFENGTNEVQYLLQFECGLLFECRVCRSIFRSILNFITHKRVYCRGKGPSDSSQTGFNEFMKDIQSLVILQEPAECEESSSPETVPANQNLTVEEEKPSPPRLSKRKGFPRRNLIEVLDRLSQKEVPEMERPVVLTSRDRACLSGVSDPKLAIPVLCLEKIEQTEVAVRQTVTLGPDGKILNDKQDNGNNDDVDNGDVSIDTECEYNQTEVINVERLCKPCNIKFSTRKTFRQHLKSKHNSNPSWYLCPDCNNVFSQVYSVHRHLRRFHRKSEAQMRKLHGKIRHLPENQLPAPYASSVYNKKPMSRIALRENKRLEGQQQITLENEVVDQCTAGKNTCGGCTRRFDRVAAFHSHTQTCPKRLAARNSNKSECSLTESPSTVLRPSIRDSAIEILGRPNVAENVHTETTTNITNPQHLTSHSEITEKAMPLCEASTAELPAATPEFQNQCVVPPMVGLNHRTRHESEMRLEAPVKRIEIQLRMDYNKASIGSSQPPSAINIIDARDNNGTVSQNKSSDWAKLDGKLELEENLLISGTQVDLLPWNNDDIVKNMKVTTVKLDNKITKKLIKEPAIVDHNNSNWSCKKVFKERRHGASADSSQHNSIATLASNSTNIDVKPHNVFSSMENVVVTCNRNEDDFVTQPVHNCDVADRPTQQPGDSVNLVVRNPLEGTETRSIVSDDDHDLKTAALEINRTNEVRELSQINNRKVTKKKVLRYRCVKCLRRFSLHSECKDHIKIVHGINLDIHDQHLASNSSSISVDSRPSTSQQTSDLGSEINGDILEAVTWASLDDIIDQPLLKPNTTEGDTTMEDTNYPLKLYPNVCTSELSEMPCSKPNSKISKPFYYKVNKDQVGNGKAIVNAHDEAAAVIGLRPKRNCVNARIKSAVPKAEKMVHIAHSVDDQRQMNLKAARRAQQEDLSKRTDIEKSVLLDSKRAKIDTASIQMNEVPSENDQARDYIPPPKHKTSSQLIVPEAKGAEGSQFISEPAKTQVQDNTNIYKNVDKSVIEIIFGSTEMGNMFSSEHFSTEEEVTIIEDQISGTFSLDVSSSPEKHKDALKITKIETQNSAVKTQRRASFSIDYKQRSSSADPEQRSLSHMETSHSIENISLSQPAWSRMKINSSNSVHNSSNAIDGDLINKTVFEGLQNFQGQRASPLIFLDNKPTNNSILNPHTMLVQTDDTTCVGNASFKQRGVSTLDPFLQEQSKSDQNKTSPSGYNISTRKSVRVFDTKPLRRTSTGDADACSKR